MHSITQFFFLSVVLSLFLTIAGGGSAEETDAEIPGNGREIVETFSCDQCHSTDGRILIEGVPRLAGQKYEYLLHQLRLFRVGEATYKGEIVASRRHSVMNRLARRLTDSHFRDIARYYSTLKCTAPVSAAPQPAGLPPNIRRCEACHGGRRTNPWRDSPYLSGPDRTYLERTIHRLWNSRQDAETDDARYHRLGEIMFVDADEPYLDAYAAYFAAIPCAKGEGADAD
ncbi:MAG: c-type cytochrome [Alphaproteobacteria bacterium]